MAPTTLTAVLSGGFTGIDLTTALVMGGLVILGLWLFARVMQAGTSLILLVVLWFVAAWLFGLPPIGGDGVLS